MPHLNFYVPFAHRTRGQTHKGNIHALLEELSIAMCYVNIFIFNINEESKKFK